MYEGYLALGGNEVINSERARIAGLAAGCPMTWYKGDQCASIQLIDAQDYADITLAPWYDPVLEESGRFYGAFGLGITGMADSTSGAPVTQSLGAGGSIGAARDATRDVRVRALLAADGADALDYGMAWLAAAVRPGACGQHGTDCGLSSLEFWSDCPPNRGIAVDWGAWTETARNLFPNPNALSGAGWTALANYSQAIPSTDGVVWTRTTTATSAANIGGAGTTSSQLAAVTAGQTYSGAIEVMPSVDMTLRGAINWRNSSNAEISNTMGDDVFCPAGVWTRIDVVGGVAPATAVAGGVRVWGPSAGRQWTTGETVAARAQSMYAGTFTRRPFSGDTVAYNDGVNQRRYSWLGTAGASVSIEESSAGTQRPQTDAEWDVTLNDTRRYLHDVANTSAPRVIEETGSGSIRAYEVEFVMTAERPWVFSPTLRLGLSPVAPVVVQDIPYNLAPYPSAEAENPVPLLVGTNYSTNPSVETDASGWAVAASGGTLTTAMLTGARSTELAADGVASYKVSFVPTGSGSNGWFGAERVVTVPEITGSPVSVTEWAASVVTVATGLTLGLRTLTVVWRNSSNTVLRTDTIGTGPIAGGAIAGSLISPPAGAANAVVRMQQAVTAFTSASRAAMYVDALALTRP